MAARFNLESPKGGTATTKAKANAGHVEVIVPNDGANCVPREEQKKWCALRPVCELFGDQVDPGMTEYMA